MSVQAWHFVKEDLTLRDGQKVKAGRVYKLPKGTEPVLCHTGYHASMRAIDALNYAPGPIVCRVELRGQVVEDTDKLVATERKVLWLADASKTLRLFACDEAAWALKRFVPNPDPRSVEAIRVARKYAHGKATDAELAAAWAAARDAAWDATPAAAWDAARAAARDRQNRKLERRLLRLGGEA